MGRRVEECKPGHTASTGRPALLICLVLRWTLTSYFHPINRPATSTLDPISRVPAYPSINDLFSHQLLWHIKTDQRYLFVLDITHEDGTYWQWGHNRSQDNILLIHKILPHALLSPVLMGFFHIKNHLMRLRVSYTRLQEPLWFHGDQGGQKMSCCFAMYPPRMGKPCPTWRVKQAWMAFCFWTKLKRELHGHFYTSVEDSVRPLDASLMIRGMKASRG